MKREFDRSSSWRCIEYWTKRGFSEVEAREEISKKQKLINSKRPSIACSEETKQKISESNKKLSTLQYWIDKFGHNEGPIKYEIYKQTLSDNGKKSSELLKNKELNRRELTPRCREFWAKKGLSEEEAISKVSETQSTFSLKKCKEKYGELEGTKLWQQRQLKWQESFNKNDISKIREKQKINSHIGFYTNKNDGGEKTLLFYLILIDNGQEKMLKYGLTKHNSVKDRWGINNKMFSYTQLFATRLNSQLAIQLEDELRKRYRGKVESSFRLTEIIDVDNLQDVKKIINEHIGSTDVIF
jgi:hypothetical protein